MLSHSSSGDSSSRGSCGPLTGSSVDSLGDPAAIAPGGGHAELAGCGHGDQGGMEQDDRDKASGDADEDDGSDEEADSAQEDEQDEDGGRDNVGWRELAHLPLASSGSDGGGDAMSGP